MDGPFSDPIVQGMLFGKARQLASDNRALSGYLDQANANMAEAQSIIDNQHAEILRLRAHIGEMVKVRDAERDALAAVTAAWRKEHDISHMHDFVGKFSDGGGMRRNARIWIDAFFEAARKRGVRDPRKWCTV